MKLSPFGHSASCLGVIPPVKKRLMPDSTLSISGSRRLRVETWIADSFFSSSVCHVMHRCQCSKDTEQRQRTGEERRRHLYRPWKKNGHFSLPQPDKLATERTRMDACYFSPLFTHLHHPFSPIPRIYSPSLSPASSRTFSVFLYLYPPHNHLSSPLSLSLPFWLSWGCWELAGITAGLATAYKLWLTSLWTNKSTTIFHAQ